MQSNVQMNDVCECLVQFHSCDLHVHTFCTTYEGAFLHCIHQVLCTGCAHIFALHIQVHFLDCMHPICALPSWSNFSLFFPLTYSFLIYGVHFIYQNTVLHVSTFCIASILFVHYIFVRFLHYSNHILYVYYNMF